MQKHSLLQYVVHSIGSPIDFLLISSSLIHKNDSIGNSWELENVWSFIIYFGYLCSSSFYNPSLLLSSSSELDYKVFISVSFNFRFFEIILGVVTFFADALAGIIFCYSLGAAFFAAFFVAFFAIIFFETLLAGMTFLGIAEIAFLRPILLIIDL